MRLLIKNGRIIDPANNIDGDYDLYAENGIIKLIGECGSAEADYIIDARGLWVVPGLIDIHTHLREPGYEYKETIETGSRSAAAGGFTTICCMPNCNPVTDSRATVENIRAIAEKTSLINILPVGSITKGQNGTELSDIEGMISAGAAALSEDGKTVANIGLMRQALLRTKELCVPILAHCEDTTLAGKGIMNDGIFSRRLGYAGITNESEDIIVSRDLLLASETGAKLHICHMSTAGSAALLRNAKAACAREGRPVNISGEAAPHHFSLSDEDVRPDLTNYKMNPPLRSREDVEAIKAALRDGTIEVIATDHAPHHIKEKNCGFRDAANGIIGLETSLALGITMLVGKAVLTPSQLISKMTVNPARVIGIDRGTLSKGAVADITIIDPDEEWIVDSVRFQSKAVNTPFDGMRLCGKVKFTIAAGKVVFMA